MSPRQARRERREAERKARKAELKRIKAARHIAPTVATGAPEQSCDRQKAVQAPNPADFVLRPATTAELCHQNPDWQGGKSRSAVPAPNSPGFVSQSSQSRRVINRANAQHSTGPRSITGKLASSRNSLQHGLASGTLIIPGEDPAAFEQLTTALLEEHQPAGDTETLLVHAMARSWWLTQRAIRLQNECFTAGGSIDEKRLSLLLRYQTTHERAFHKALNTLIKLKRTHDHDASQNRTPTGTEGIGFVSQNTKSPAAAIGFVSQNRATGAPNPPTLAETA